MDIGLEKRSIRGISHRAKKAGATLGLKTPPKFCLSINSVVASSSSVKIAEMGIK